MIIPTTKVGQRRIPMKQRRSSWKKKENFMGPKRGGSLKKVLQGGSEDEAWEHSRKQVTSCCQECFFHRAKRAKSNHGREAEVYGQEWLKWERLRLFSRQEIITTLNPEGEQDGRTRTQVERSGWGEAGSPPRLERGHRDGPQSIWSTQGDKDIPPPARGFLASRSMSIYFGHMNGLCPGRHSQSFQQCRWPG